MPLHTIYYVSGLFEMKFKNYVIKHIFNASLLNKIKFSRKLYIFYNRMMIYSKYISETNGTQASKAKISNIRGIRNALP